jgi:DNA/RNA-binding domain of Phe-tRNA-synthetase-like protein
VVSPEIFELFPGLRLAVAMAEDLEGTRDNPKVEELWRTTWAGAARLASSHGNAQSHPRVRAWRDAMGSLGVSGRRFPSSVEALLRRAMKGGEPFSVNPLVDFYNRVSLEHLVPAGGFDLGRVDDDPLELRLTREGDAFEALDASAPEPAEPGEVAYASGNTVLTRHFVWKQSRAGLLTPSTRSVFLVSEILGEVEEGADEPVAGAVLEDLAGGLIRHFGAEPRGFLVDEENPEASW